MLVDPLDECGLLFLDPIRVIVFTTQTFVSGQNIVQRKHKHSSMDLVRFIYIVHVISRAYI